jgi:DNA adenine methylase
MSAQQTSYLDNPLPERPVNVASVPQRSPFRYPGGKTWLVPLARRWLAARRPAILYEPFCGGGIISLTAAAEGLARHVVMVELDPAVAAVWTTILTDQGGGEWLAERITEFALSEERVRAELAREPTGTRDLAWLTLLRNRTQRGGIMAPGAGLIRYGEAGKGVASRWYPETLARRILDIVAIRDRITFHHRDAFAVLREYGRERNAAWFLDPPYTAGQAGKRAGVRLYSHAGLDHQALFAAAADLAGDPLLTYDADDEVRGLAREYGLVTREVAMQNTHLAKMRELIIGRDLSWAG